MFRGISKISFGFSGFQGGFKGDLERFLGAFRWDPLEFQSISGVFQKSFRGEGGRGANGVSEGRIILRYFKGPTGEFQEA